MDMEEKKLTADAAEQALPVQELPADIPAEVRQKLAEDLNEEATEDLKQDMREAEKEEANDEEVKANPEMLTKSRLLKLLIKGTSTAFVGDLANFLVGCSFVLPASILYQATLSKKGAIWSLTLGTMVMTVFGSAFNAVYLLPKFAQLYGIPLDTIIAMGTAIRGGVSNVSTFVLLCVAPLNLLKGAVVSVLTMLLYKRVARPLFGLHQ